MIPKKMKEFLQDALVETTWELRLKKDGPLRFMQFERLDVDRLHSLGIEVDRLGPRLVVCMWDDESPLEIGGYLVVDNLAMGTPAMGGIRLGPDIKPLTIFNLARGMTLKNAAADLPYGGGKAGIVAGRDLSSEDHETVIRGFAHLIRRYKDIYNPGPDVGTDDADMKTIAIENGLNFALSKPVEMGGNRIDELGGAAGGTVIAMMALHEQLDRLRVLPQFRDLRVPELRDVTVIIQGFGAVGAHAARMLGEVGPGGPPKVVGISDEQGYLFSEDGLDARKLFELWETGRVVTFPYFQEALIDDRGPAPRIIFSNSCNNLLRESAFCLIPAAPVANYLDIDEASGPSMTVDRMGRWSMIVEGANTYSPDPKLRAARTRMERKVYGRMGVLIATDYLVNSGGVIFAAYERMIPTPESLAIPPDRLGDRAAVDAWLEEHADAFAALAEERRIAAFAKRDEVLRRNMTELIDHLSSDADLLPCEAAERIAVKRIASSERYRKVSNIMAPILTIQEGGTIHDAARMLYETNNDLLAVTAEDGTLVGVVTDWDVTRAMATARGCPEKGGVENGCAEDLPLRRVMTTDLFTAHTDDSILDVLRRLEHHEISAMPVVEGNRAIGVISGDILAQRTLYRLLQVEAG